MRRVLAVETANSLVEPRKLERVAVTLPGGFDEARHRAQLQDRIVG